jgi:hypothetical protein
MEGAGGNADANQPNIIAVTSTVSRFSLGVKIRVPFVEGKHLEEDKEWDECECEWKARSQMEWYLEKVCTEGVHLKTTAKPSLGRECLEKRPT